MLLVFSWAVLGGSSWSGESCGPLSAAPWDTPTWNCIAGRALVRLCSLPSFKELPSCSQKVGLTESIYAKSTFWFIIFFLPRVHLQSNVRIQSLHIHFWLFCIKDNRKEGNVPLQADECPVKDISLLKASQKVSLVKQVNSNNTMLLSQDSEKTIDLDLYKKLKKLSHVFLPSFTWTITPTDITIIITGSWCLFWCF